VKFKLIKINQLSGRKTKIYSVLLENESKSLFENFLEENTEKNKPEILEILQRVNSIAQKEGAKEHYFKKAEGALGDGVEALYDDINRKLRLYCIRYGSVVLILGGGGAKNVRALQDDPKLKKENYVLRQISKILTQAMKEGELQWNNDFDDFTGNLTFDDNED
jgi:putative component of toxin-antitoxin plasmid stabilization module